jgi:pyridoxamine 5'-phosphate oxidase
MAERSGIFAGDDPFRLVRDWMDEAARHEPSDPNAIALATCDADGLPNVRMVLLKEVEDDAFVFYTNYDSAKGRELGENARAAFVIHWKSLARQIRVRGAIAREEGPQADAYYASRALQSRLGAWASRQSHPLSSREALVADVARMTARHGITPKRPPHWGGFRLHPVEIEFWADGAFRLHDRFRWTRPEPGVPWEIARLYP